VFVRPGELRNTEWSELKLEEATWLIPGAKMKTGNDQYLRASKDDQRHESQS
jgi:integrase